MARIDGRAADQLRPVEIIPNINKFAEGSCLIRCGNTHVLCCASVEERTPPHVPEGEGWVTAEYSMLPRANRERSKRDIAKLKLSPRSAEIQRLVGRSLRAAVDLAKLGEHTITIDCDVLQGDGGTRTASGTNTVLLRNCRTNPGTSRITLRIVHLRSVMRSSSQSLQILLRRVAVHSTFLPQYGQVLSGRSSRTDFPQWGQRSSHHTSPRSKRKISNPA